MTACWSGGTVEVPRRQAREASFMPTQQIENRKLPVVEQASPGADDPIRQLAIKEIERKRHFQRRAFSTGAAMIALVVIWAISEYNNAGGWPSDGFSQSSGISHVWNIWIIYPLLGLSLWVAIDAWNTYARKPIKESEIRREMERLTH
jgi:2TM domain